LTVRPIKKRRNIIDNIEWFFKNPRIVPQKDGLHSQLYLLRRDIDTCFGTDPNTGFLFDPIDKITHKEINCKAIWPGAMCILAGVDLLSKFLYGSDKSSGKSKDSVKWRFENYIIKYFGIDQYKAHILFQLRNSLLHSFGLYSEEIIKGKLVTYNFLLDRSRTCFIKHLKNDYYQIDVQILREKFNLSIEKYERDIKNNLSKDFYMLIHNFNIMYPKHAKPMLCN
jgi:hypothetical protein